MSKSHFDIKVSPREFIAIENGEKKHFLYDTKEYVIDTYDILHFREWTESDGYSGRHIDGEVTYTEDKSKRSDLDFGCASFKLF